MTTDPQHCRLTRDEWLALSPEEQPGAPLDDARTKPKDHACYAHHLLNGTPAQLEYVEVEGSVAETVIRLALASDLVDAQSTIAGLTESWRDAWTNAPIANKLVFEVVKPN